MCLLAYSWGKRTQLKDMCSFTDTELTKLDERPHLYPHCTHATERNERDQPSENGQWAGKYLHRCKLPPRYTILGSRGNDLLASVLERN